MGLPLFVPPPDSEDSAQSVEKAAAQSRSSIRRSRTIRRPTSVPGSAAGDLPFSILRRGLTFADAVDSSSPGSQDGDEERERMEIQLMEMDRRRRAMMNGAPVAIPSPWRSRSPPPLPRLMRENSAPRVQPHDGFTWGSITADGPVAPPAPESSDFQRRQRRNQEEQISIMHRLYEQRARLRRAARVNFNSTPFLPFETRASPDNLSPDGFSFSAGVHAEPRSYLSRLTRGPSGASDDAATEASSRSPPSRQRTEVSPPIFARDSVARIRALRQSRLDGLGDRDRSLSPEGDGAWDTLLTTISPDPQPPSVGSSFASTTASAVASASSQARSSGTSATTVDGPEDASFENVCDLIESRDPSSETDEDEEDMYELRDNVSASREQFWRSYTDMVTERAERVARHSGQADADGLGGMQRIVRRLARREDIPDEWWQEAGLSRTLSREATR